MQRLDPTVRACNDLMIGSFVVAGLRPFQNANARHSSLRSITCRLCTDRLERQLPVEHLQQESIGTIHGIITAEHIVPARDQAA